MMKTITITAILVIVLSSTITAQNWEVVNLPFNDDITGITFLNPDTVILCTSSGKVAVTHNACQTWKVQSIAFLTHLEDVSFADANLGLVCGKGGGLFRTTDGGQTWNNVSLKDTSVIFFDVEMLDRKIGIAIGMDQQSEVPWGGIAYRSTDGGKNWKKIDINGLAFSEIVVKSDGEVYFPAIGQLIHSHDKGQTWQSTRIPEQLKARSLSLYGQSGLMAGPHGSCAVSSDGGTSWKIIEQDNSLNLIIARLIDEKTAFIAGADALMMRSDDGGLTWDKRELLAKSFHVLDMCLIDRRLYAVGTNGSMIYKIVR